MNKLDKQYTDLLQDILDNGVKKEDRTGTGTLSVFGRQIRHKMSDGFPLLTTKKMAWKTMVTELLWFLRGSTNIKYLVDNGCHIWVGDSFSNYLKTLLTLEKNGNHHEMNKWMQDWGDGSLSLYTKEEFIEKIKTDDEFAKKWGELGRIYGHQWRNWGGRKTDGFIEYENNGYSEDIKGIDQISELIRQLKETPDSRRMIINTWNVGELDQMVLPPCHYGFQVYTRELSHKERCDLFGKNDDISRTNSYSEWLDDNGYPKRAISLMFNMRSTDIFLGLPFNIASYGLLLEIIAKEVNMVPDELIGNLGDTHLYLNHIEQAKEQIGRELTFDERYELFKKYKEIQSDKTFEEDEGNSLGKISVLNMMDEARIPTRTREPFELPELYCMDEYHYLTDLDIPFGEKINKFRPDFFIIEKYQSHPAIKAPLSN